MRAVVFSALMVVGIAGTVAADPAGVGPAAAIQPQRFAVEAIQPTPDDVVGVAHPVVVTFSEPVADREAAELAVDVTSVPAMTGEFEWRGDRVVHWVPDRFWPAHSTVTLAVGTQTSSFKTGRVVVGVADISERTFTVTIDGLEAGTAAPRMPAPHHLPHSGEEGVMLATMGKEAFPTPVGTYSVLSKDRSIVMDSSSVGIPLTDPEGYLLEVDHAVRITTRGIFVHSAPWAVHSLGLENVSHGCISLNPAAAQWYFDTVTVGDPVIVQE